MHHHKTYMYSNYQQNRVGRSVKTVHTNLFAKNCKLHNFATCNSNFEKSRLFGHALPLNGHSGQFLINRPIRSQLPRKEIISTDDR